MIITIINSELACASEQKFGTSVYAEEANAQSRHGSCQVLQSLMIISLLNLGLLLKCTLQVTPSQVEVAIEMTISVLAKHSCEQNLRFNTFLSFK